ncbi:MAG: HAD family hydrolase [Enterococcus sp.]|nr:HAD family hydrolase [Enterococcus sp.]MBP8693124.1 HAD family hydrolase [Enterococcus sp.]MBP9520769.1 HAD family hydrolase [Enterococcus sp.]
MVGSRKLLAFDIDGTILDSNKRPLPSTLEALDALRKAGHFVTLATGRSRFLAESVIRELQFENYILCNGAAGFFNHQQVFKETLDQQALTTLIEVCQARGIDTAIVQLDQSKRLSSFDLEKMQDAMTSFGSTASELGELAHDDEVYQALAYYEKDCDPLFEGQHPAFNFVRWHEKCVDVIPANGSKARTLLALAERLGIDRADIIGFGDGLNDREMLRESGIGVAMGNASLLVQQEADLVTKDHNHDGIWHALKELHLID